MGNKTIMLFKIKVMSCLDEISKLIIIHHIRFSNTLYPTIAQIRKALYWSHSLKVSQQHIFTVIVVNFRITVIAPSKI
jgi:hypothetical protein